MNFEVLKRRTAPALCSFLAASKLYKLATPIFGGMGSILNLHRVLPARTGPRITSVRALEVTPQWIDESIRFFSHLGIEIIDMDTLVAMLSGEIPSRRFVIYSFDDGYEDNVIHAYPVFRRNGAPFTVNVVASFPERQMIPWWMLLEDLILGNQKLRVVLHGEVLNFDCRNEVSRERAFYRLRSAILAGIQVDYMGTLRQVFVPYTVDIYKYSGIGMSWDQVRELSRDPLVTIGAHGVRHVPLAKLPADELMRELADSRTIIERQIGRPVDHFAFPYGSPGEAGTREFAAVEAVGYKTAVTTRPANIFAQHRRYLSCLPRNLVSGEREGRNVNLMNLWLSGTIPALENCLRRRIAG